MSELVVKNNSEITASTGLPEDSPLVSMDISLGKKYQEVNFDYDSFQQEAARLGLSPQDTAGMPMRIKAPRLKDVKGGFYDIDGDKGITVNANNKTNRRISHELKHKADDIKGMPMKDAKYKVGRSSAIIFDKAAALGLIGGVAAVAGSEAAEHIVTNPAYLIGLGGTALAATGYVFHPAERRARKAAESSSAQIVNFVKRAK